VTRQRQDGFTLIEAAVAIAVVAILSGIIAPLVIKSIGDAQQARAKNDIQVIAAAIASQIKDTGGRPSVAATGLPNAANAVIWGSGGAEITGFTMTGNGSFANLFTAPTTGGTSANLNTMFGTASGNEFSYKGPYMTADMTAKTDPWGSRYLILGYDGVGQAANGPIWIVCAGPNKGIDAVANSAASTTWSPTLASVDDIVMRVN
jgi:prepilin-type N-terminal cleavage/methylation domain-containing protein